MAAFSIEHLSFGEFQLIKLSNTKSGVSLSVIPDLAGLINEYIVSDHNGNLHSIVDGYESAEELLEKHTQVFKSAKLSPFPNRIKEGTYSFKEDDHQLHVNFPHERNSIHGLVFDEAFRVEREEEGEDFAHLTLSYDYKGDKPGYPFTYYLQLDYQLHEVYGLTITTIIKNTGDQPMPLGDGWHPYFRTGNKVDNLEISFPSDYVYEIDDQMIPTRKRHAFDDFKRLKQINNYQFDSCFSLSTNNGKAFTRVEDPQNNIRFTIWQETGRQKYNYLQVYTPPDRKSIAFEPMTCPPDVFNNEIDLIILAPGEEISLSWGVSS